MTSSGGSSAARRTPASRRPRYEHLIDRLGLTDYLLDRFAFAGTPEEIRRKVERLAALGIDKFLLNVAMSEDVERDIRLLAQALRPVATR